jgi:hypothetical protein
MVTYQIYSVSDKEKVDAEVVEVREVSGSRGVRYQVVGLTPAGKNVSTFCNQQTAEDLRAQLGVAEAPEPSETIELAAEEESTEEVEVSEEEMLDRIVEIEEEADAPLDLEVDEGKAPVIDDKTGELIETEVFAAEEPVPVEEDPGESFDAEHYHLYDITYSNRITLPVIKKKLKSAGIKPNALYQLDLVPNEDDIVFGIHIKSSDVKAFEKEFNKKDWKGIFERVYGAESFEAEGEAEVEVQEEEQYDEVPDETGGGISPTPPEEPEESPVAEETEIDIPAGDTSGLVPLSEQIPEGYGPVLGQQTLQYNFGPMHAETEGEGAPPGDEYALMEQLVRLEEKMDTEGDEEKRVKIEKKIIGIVGQLEDIASEDADRGREYDRGQPLYYPDDEDDEGYDLWEQWDAEGEGTLGRKLLIPGIVLGGFALIAAFKPELVKNLLDNFKKE